MQEKMLLNLILLGIIIIISISFHEFSHTLAAYLLGDSTSKDQGRLTLDPSKQITFLGLIFMILTLFRFGWGNPTPINSSNLKNPKLDILIISIVGPLSNFLISIISLIIIKLLVISSINITTTNKIINILYEVIMINIGLGIFNLIPIPPLDGGNFLLYITRNNTINKYITQYSLYLLILIILPIIPWNGGYYSIIDFIIMPIIDKIYSVLILL
jgi:Zn-dependent protease